MRCYCKPSITRCSKWLCLEREWYCHHCHHSGTGGLIQLMYKKRRVFYEVMKFFPWISFAVYLRLQSFTLIIVGGSELIDCKPRRKLCNINVFSCPHDFFVEEIKLQIGRIHRSILHIKTAIAVYTSNHDEIKEIIYICKST